MRTRFRLKVPPVGLLLLLYFPACDGAPGVVSGDGGAGGMGGATEPPAGECALTEDAVLSIGEGVGSAFEELEDGDRLKLEFASQAGMEAYFSILGSSIALGDIVSVQAALMVGEHPIGLSTTNGESVRCDDGFIRLDTGVPIDVSLHPDIVSVAQLVDREATLVVELMAGDGVFVSQSVTVILDP